VEVPKPDFAVHPPPLCEAITEVDYARYIEKADEQVSCQSSSFLPLNNIVNHRETTYNEIE